MFTSYLEQILSRVDRYLTFKERELANHEAAEKIFFAQRDGCACGCKSGLENSVGAETAAADVAQMNPKDAANPVEPENDRDALLKRCAELGLEVPAKTKTPTLIKMVAKAEQDLKEKELVTQAVDKAFEIVDGEAASTKEAAAAVTEEDPFGDTPPVVVELNGDIVKQMLKDVAAKHGRDKGIEVMREVGQAEKVSEIMPALWAKVAAACQTLLKK